MTKYRKKPIVVDAVQWFPDKPVEGVKFPAYPNQIELNKQMGVKIYGKIKTLEGDHIVSPGDWVITGIAGEKYPCKPDIFKQTYEVVE